MKLTDIDHEADGRVHVRWGKHGLEFPSLDVLKSWVESVLAREDVRRAMLLRRALRVTNGTLKPVRDCRGLKVDINLDADSPVTIGRDVAT